MNIEEIIKEQGGVWASDGWVVAGNLDLRNLGLISLPKIKEVGGWFDCSHNNLTSLEGCPSSVGEGFDCHNNKLTSLEGCPSSVGGNFYCGYNKLASLEGCPSSVGGDFNCSNNAFSYEYYQEWFLQRFFEATPNGWIVYKAFGKDTPFNPPSHWKIEEGSVLEEKADLNPDNDCAPGVNFATQKWINTEYKNIETWKCLLPKDAKFVCPYNSNGKARSNKLVLLKKL